MAIQLKFIPRWLKILPVVIIAVFSAGGFWFYQAQEQAMNRRVENELVSLARLKAQRLSDWLEDQLADSAAIRDHPFISRSITRFLAGNGEFDAGNLLEQFQSFAKQHDYEDFFW